MISSRLSIGLVTTMLCSLAVEKAIQHLGLHVVALKLGLLCVLSNLACMQV